MGAEIDANEGSANAYVATAKLSGSNQNYELKNATTTYYILKKSETLSPFAAELESAEENPRTCPPRFIMADSKLSLVRVLGS